MASEPHNAVVALNRRFLLDYPAAAALQIERIPADEAAEALGEQPATVLAPVIGHLSPDFAAELFAELPDALVAQVLGELSPNDAARFMAAIEPQARAPYFAQMPAPVAEAIEQLLLYPEDSAGRLMETQLAHFRGSETVEATLDRLRQRRSKATRSLFIADEHNRLASRVNIQDIAVAPAGTLLSELAMPIRAVSSPIMPRAELVELLERHRLVDMPVVDAEGRLLGIIYHDALIQAIHEDATADIQSMVGASRDERALSAPLFAVRKRLPWLQINLLTAFAAAAVVGLFEDTIARFTALAVLLPVVAGQSGNAGAQALAVTMRGLALREINLRHWLQVTLKELQVGFLNGIAVALTCGVGVYFWSGSFGLVLVISMSMVLAMVAAGFAGALVPISLTRLGQDPAQSSSIILTTVTDIAGFLSFLGIATLLASML